jgi:thiol-disulfide isomerase/thioredoxin
MILIFRLLVLLLCFLPLNACAQNTITGHFPNLANQQVKLTGYEGFDTYPIDSVKVDKNGAFQLSFNQKDYGMGYLAAVDNKAFIVILTENENLKLEGGALANSETVEITSGQQNRQFEKFASEHRQREQTLSAWDYLARTYEQDSLFMIHAEPKEAIAKEKQRIQEEDSTYLANLNPETYVSWFLPVRKLVSSVSTIAQYRTEKIPATIDAFRELDYTDERLYKSGLLKETIENHFWLIENSGRPLDSVYAEMKISIDYMIDDLLVDERKFNEITDYLFKLLEQRSLFEASEYLALKVLNETSCTLDNDLAAQLESYRAMKKGNTAPDFEFNGDVFAPAYQSGNIPEKLSDLNNAYTVLVFGASWCPACPEELSQIAGLYEEWKKHGIEVVFVSLDEDKQTFKNFAGNFPFISLCNYKKWEYPVVKDYHVFATPTMYLLDSKREILLRPNSVNHMDSWVDWYLTQGHSLK